MEGKKDAKMLVGVERENTANVSKMTRSGTQAIRWLGYSFFFCH
jgi:hypothetical protein